MQHGKCGNNKKSIAIITARGGSKRLPKKNIREFCGKPIIQYSINAALKSGIFDEVMVSTEDVEIKGISEKYGAKVPFMRSEQTATDVSMTHEVILEVLERYRDLGQSFDYVCCIYPTAPFITPDILQKAGNVIEETGADSVIPVVAFSFPPQRGFVLRDGKVDFKWPKNRLVRSQDLEKIYHDCGQFYFLRTKRFLETKSMVMDTTIPIIMDEMEVQDIDNEEDWKLAELKYQMRNE